MAFNRNVVKPIRGGGAAGSSNPYAKQSQSTNQVSFEEFKQKTSVKPPVSRPSKFSATPSKPKMVPVDMIGIGDAPLVKPQD